MNIDTFFSQVTNPKQILGKTKDLLSRVNPQFSEEEKKYDKAVEQLKKLSATLFPLQRNT